jgi:hypothetical protein
MGASVFFLDLPAVVAEVEVGVDDEAGEGFEQWEQSEDKRVLDQTLIKPPAVAVVAELMTD